MTDPIWLRPESTGVGRPAEHARADITAAAVVLAEAQTSGTTSGAPSRAESAVSSSGIFWLSRSASTRLR